MDRESGIDLYTICTIIGSVLSIYRRHRPKCKFATDRNSRKCRCAIWATGTLEGKPYRRALKTRSRKRAEHLNRGLENSDKLQLSFADRHPHLAQASSLPLDVDAFLADYSDQHGLLIGDVSRKLSCISASSQSSPPPSESVRLQLENSNLPETRHL